MPTINVFTLVANDGKSDTPLLAIELLKRRLKEIVAQREKKGLKDTTPTLMEIEKTHVLFVNSHFKPFAATAHEYNKVGPSGGLPQFDGTVSFGIPQFGDFLADMVVHVVLGSVSVASTTPTTLTITDLRNTLAGMGVSSITNLNADGGTLGSVYVGVT